MDAPSSNNGATGPSKREERNYSCPCLLLLSGLVLWHMPKKPAGEIKRRGRPGPGAGEAVAHIELAAVTLMSKVIRRGFFHLLFSLISISHSSLPSKCVSLLLLLPPILLKILPELLASSLFLTFCFAAHKYPRTAGSFNAEPMKHPQEFLATHSTLSYLLRVASRAYHHRNPTLFSPELESVNPP